MRDEFERLLQMAAKMPSPDTGLSGIDIPKVVTNWENREWEEGSARFKSVSDYVNDFQVKISVDIGLWLQEWDIADADPDFSEGTGQERFCHFFNHTFGSAYLIAPATGQEASDDIEDELYDMAGGNLEQSDDDVDSIYGAGDGITIKFLGSDAQDLVSPRSPKLSVCSDVDDAPEQNVLYEHCQSDQVPEVEHQGASASDWKEE
jgi:hypothetical protein